MSLADSSERTAPSGKARGPRKHPAPPRRPPASPTTLQTRTPFNIGITTLWPWSLATYPGILKGASELLLGRAPWYCVRDWRRGTRQAPQWALDLLAEAIRQRMASLAHALAIVENEKGRP